MTRLTPILVDHCHQKSKCVSRCKKNKAGKILKYSGKKNCRPEMTGSLNSRAWRTLKSFTDSENYIKNELSILDDYWLIALKRSFVTILVLWSFMRFFACAIFRLTHLTFRPQMRDKHVAFSYSPKLYYTLRMRFTKTVLRKFHGVEGGS